MCVITFLLRLGQIIRIWVLSFFFILYYVYSFGLLNESNLTLATRRPSYLLVVINRRNIKSDCAKIDIKPKEAVDYGLGFVSI